MRNRRFWVLLGFRNFGDRNCSLRVAGCFGGLAFYGYGSKPRDQAVQGLEFKRKSSPSTESIPKWFVLSKLFGVLGKGLQCKSWVDI